MPTVEIYSKISCPYCDRAKQLLTSKKVEFIEIRVDQDPKCLEEMLTRSPGMRTVPQIYINNHFIGGFDDMVALDRAGKLDLMLKE